MCPTARVNVCIERELYNKLLILKNFSKIKKSVSKLVVEAIEKMLEEKIRENPLWNLRFMAETVCKTETEEEQRFYEELFKKINECSKKESGEKRVYEIKI